MMVHLRSAEVHRNDYYVGKDSGEVDSEQVNPESQVYVDWYRCKYLGAQDAIEDETTESESDDPAIRCCFEVVFLF